MKRFPDIWFKMLEAASTRRTTEQLQGAWKTHRGFKGRPVAEEESAEPTVSLEQLKRKRRSYGKILFKSVFKKSEGTMVEQSCAQRRMADLATGTRALPTADKEHAYCCWIGPILRLPGGSRQWPILQQRATAGSVACSADHPDWARRVQAVQLPLG